MNKQYRLEATLVATAKELKDQKTPKAKRIVVGTDVHLRSYQAARKVDNAAIGAVANFCSETELLLYVEKQCEQAEEVVVVYEAGPLGYGLYRKLTARGVKCLVCAPDSTQMVWRIIQFQPQYPPVQKWQEVLRGTNRTLKKKAAVAIGRQLMVDLWRMETGRVTAQELNLVMVGA